MSSGGKREGSGRPVSTAPQSVVFQIRCTELQRQTIKDLGGSKWVKRKIDEEIAKKS